jgi:acyl carrier protein
MLPELIKALWSRRAVPQRKRRAAVGLWKHVRTGIIAGASPRFARRGRCPLPLLDDSQKMDSLSMIRGFVAKHGGIDPEKIVPAARLEDVGVDSLMLLELLFEFEEQSGIDLPKDLPNPQTVGDLVTQLEKLGTGSASAA